VTPPLLFGNPAASQPARRSLGFAPPPHDGFAFLASAPEMRVQAPYLPTGDKFATVFEVVGIFFRLFLVLRTFLGVGSELRRECDCRARRLGKLRRFRCVRTSENSVKAKFNFGEFTSTHSGE
jgi:hypothetical protein